MEEIEIGNTNLPCSTILGTQGQSVMEEIEIVNGRLLWNIVPFFAQGRQDTYASIDLPAIDNDNADSWIP